MLGEILQVVLNSAAFVLILVRSCQAYKRFGFLSPRARQWWIAIPAVVIIVFVGYFPSIRSLPPNKWVPASVLGVAIGFLLLITLKQQWPPEESPSRTER